MKQGVLEGLGAQVLLAAPGVRRGHFGQGYLGDQWDQGVLTFLLQGNQVYQEGRFRLFALATQVVQLVLLVPQAPEYPAAPGDLSLLVVLPLL